MNPFVVPVGSLTKHVGSTSDVAFSAAFDPEGLLAAVAPGAPEVVPGADVEVRLGLASYLGGLTAAGTLRVPWRAACRRCATDVGGVLEVRVSERFTASAGPDDEDAYPLVGDEIDLTALVRDAVVLELPLAPLCRDDCAGLCPQCGTDRNVGPCACEPEVDPRWATLDALRVPDQA
ncbi:MAG TPA: DUF177 domain-containing protein [Acidimicrobiales bacterium]